MRRNQESRVDSYARQVSVAFSDTAGVPYREVREDFESHPVTPRLAEAFAAGTPPDKFAGAIVAQFGLKQRADDPMALYHNRRVAALVEYAAEADWTPGADGAIYRDGPEGLERIAPGYDASRQNLGFAAATSPTGRIEVRDGMAVAVGAKFQDVTGALDIGDAVERLEATYTRSLGM